MPRPAASSNSQPTSLIHAGHTPAVACPECGGSRLTEIGMTLTDGSQVRFSSCHRCETRYWREAGSELALDMVMDKARKIKK